MRDTNARAFDLFGNDGNLLNIPMNEIERIGEWLINNPNAEISEQFNSTAVKKIKYPIQQIKEKCRTSKVFLSMIKNAYESIRNLLLKSKENIKIQEEYGR